MEHIAVSGLVAVAVSAVLQMMKDHLGLKAESLQWVALILGGVGTGASGFLAGGTDSQELVTNGGVGGGLTLATHTFLKGDSFLGRVLKGVGDSIFVNKSKPPSTPTPSS